jgi:hypothetical protein
MDDGLRLPLGITQGVGRLGKPDLHHRDRQRPLVLEDLPTGNVSITIRGEWSPRQVGVDKVNYERCVGIILTRPGFTRHEIPSHPTPPCRSAFFREPLGDFSARIRSPLLGILERGNPRWSGEEKRHPVLAGGGFLYRLGGKPGWVESELLRRSSPGAPFSPSLR